VDVPDVYARVDGVGHSPIIAQVLDEVHGCHVAETAFSSPPP
jgi:hypothetical protein